jgi:hypothetical protein
LLLMELVFKNYAVRILTIFMLVDY